DAPADPRRGGPAHQAGLPAGRPVRLPDAGGPVRELVAAAGDHPDRADVFAGGDHRRVADGPGQQHLHPDRARRADRPGGQERDPHRRVRQGARSRRPEPVRRGGGGLPHAPPADPDDVVRLHPGRGAAGPGQGGRGRDALLPGRGRLQRHAGRDAVRHLLHAGVLRRHPLADLPRQAGPGAGPAGAGGGPGGRARRGRTARRDGHPAAAAAVTAGPGRPGKRASSAIVPVAGRFETAMTSANTSGRSSPLGATVVDGGVNFSLFSRTASGVDLLLFDREDDAAPARVVRIDPGTNRTYHYWHVFVPGVRPGQIYGYRVEGPSAPARGLRFDPTKVLLDPYGRGVVVPRNYDREAARGPGENAGTAMKSVVVDPDTYDWE